MSEETVNPPAAADLSATPPVNSVESVPLTSPAAPPVPPTEDINRVPMGRLSAIEIHNYRAYRGRFRLELPKGENLLVYGENGAGKSSLFHTLRTFLEAPDIRVPDTAVVYGTKTPRNRPLALMDNQHRFTKDAPSVKLEFGQRAFESSLDCGKRRRLF